mgnify:FL=1
MTLMYEFIKWMAVNILGEPFILVGLIVLLGLLLQNKSLNVLASGTIKAMIGFLIIGAGAGIIAMSST